MVQLSCLTAATICILISGIAAQQFPPSVPYDDILTSPIDPRFTVSYKETNSSTCATAFASKKQYSGYIRSPPSYPRTEPINTFFWFFEARHQPKTAPLTIWLNGGQRASSMQGLFQEIGPCEVIPNTDGTYSTKPRLWGWDRSSNLLFIDQSFQAGFSFSERANGSIDYASGFVTYVGSDDTIDVSAPSWRYTKGTFPRRDGPHPTGLSPEKAAQVCWHLMQTFLSKFPHYHPDSHTGRRNIKPAVVHLFAENFGSAYSAVFADFFHRQNSRRDTGSITPKSLDIQLGSVGVMGGRVDLFINHISTVDFKRRNTYDIRAIDLRSSAESLEFLRKWCEPLESDCLGGAERYPSISCDILRSNCNLVVDSVLAESGTNPHDIRYRAEVGPGSAYEEYLNTAEVLSSIGAQVNFTRDIRAPSSDVWLSQDLVLESPISSLATLLDRGVRVAFINGDADAISTWHSGEHVSLAVARLDPVHRAGIVAAGYEDILIGDSHVGGQVRQHGNLSFSRIYDAGNFVPYSQPETAFNVFTRILNGASISTGEIIDMSTYGTSGSARSEHQNRLDPPPERVCWLRDLDTCTIDERESIWRGEGLAKDGMWFPDSSDIHMAPRSTSTTSVTLNSHLNAPATASTVYWTGNSPATIVTTTASSGGASQAKPLPIFRRAIFPPEGKRRRLGFILAYAVPLGIVLIILALAALCWCCARRRRQMKKQRFNDDFEQTPTMVEVVRPEEQHSEVVQRVPMETIREVRPSLESTKSVPRSNTHDVELLRSIPEPRRESSNDPVVILQDKPDTSDAAPPVAIVKQPSIKDSPHSRRTTMGSIPEARSDEDVALSEPSEVVKSPIVLPLQKKDPVPSRRTTTVESIPEVEEEEKVKDKPVRSATQ